MPPPMQAKVAAYQSVAAHGSVAAADPHSLIMLLLDGALARIAQARSCNERTERSERVRHIERAMAMVIELRASLDLSQGALARNLDDLYDFVTRQLLLAQVSSDPRVLLGTASILQEIRAAWSALPLDARNIRPAKAAS